MKNFLSFLRLPGWRRLLWAPLLCLLLAVSGCGGKSANADSSAQTAQQSSAATAVQEASEPADSGGESGPDESLTGGPPDTEESAPELVLLPETGDRTSGGQISDGQTSDGQTSDGQISGDVVQAAEGKDPDSGGPSENALLPEDGTYTTADDVALYLHTYGKLPDNFMTKKEAKKLGWSGGSLEDYAPGMCIGGDYFGNYEGALPDGNYHECDINTLGKKKRGAERLIFSDDGRIYYTRDHYKTFTLLYGEE